MSKLMRTGAVLMAALMVLAVGTPAVLAHEPVTVEVDEGESTYTVTVEHNGSAVENASVDVDATNASNSSYSASGDTGPNGTVTFDLPENETEVNITATFENHTETKTHVLLETDESDGNETKSDDPFGQRLTTWLHNLLGASNDKINGQNVSAWVTANNPGSEHRSDNATPGGNGNGPPDHAKDKGSNDVNDSVGELEVTFDGEATANETGNVTVTHNGSAVENATVSVDGEEVGTTNDDGVLEVTLPDKPGETVTISAELDDLEGETELNLAE